jgi:hypothetical protein
MCDKFGPSKAKWKARMNQEVGRFSIKNTGSAAEDSANRPKASNFRVETITKVQSTAIIVGQRPPLATPMALWCVDLRFLGNPRIFGGYFLSLNSPDNSMFMRL